MRIRKLFGLPIQLAAFLIVLVLSVAPMLFASALEWVAKDLLGWSYGERRTVFVVGFFLGLIGMMVLLIRTIIGIHRRDQERIRGLVAPLVDRNCPNCSHVFGSAILANVREEVHLPPPNPRTHLTEFPRSPCIRCPHCSTHWAFFEGELQKLAT